jgi:hypothetical protein
MVRFERTLMSSWTKKPKRFSRWSWRCVVRQSGSRVEGGIAFMVRCIVKEIPQVEEAVGGYAARDTCVEIKEARDLSAKLNGVAPDDLGGNIFVAVSPLV